MPSKPGQIPLLAIPSYVGFSPQAREDLLAFETNLRALTGAHLGAVQDWLRLDPVNNPDAQPVDVRALAHPLSAEYMLSHQRRRRPARSVGEMAVFFEEAQQPVAEMVQTQERWEAFLLRLSARLEGPGAFRRGSIATGEDLEGNWREFPEPGLIAGRMRDLRLFLIRAQSAPAAFRATVLMNCLLNTHPFTDANGRVSRVLFHWILRDVFPAACYLPIFELGQLSRGGFIIRLRQAQWRCDWDPLCAYWKSLSEIVLGLC